MQAECRRFESDYLHQIPRLPQAPIFGGILKRSTRADCKSAGLRLPRFESLPHHHLKNPNKIRGFSVFLGGFKSKIAISPNPLKTHKNPYLFPAVITQLSPNYHPKIFERLGRAGRLGLLRPLWGVLWRVLAGGRCDSPKPSLGSWSAGSFDRSRRLKAVRWRA